MHIYVGGMPSKQKIKNLRAKFNECGKCHSPSVTKTVKFFEKQH